MNVIELRGVSVRYRYKKIRSLKEAVTRGLTAHARAGFFYGLRDVSLSVRRGEAVGIVGGNDAALLRVAAGIIAPSAGVAIRRGAVAPVMELGRDSRPSSPAARTSSSTARCSACPAPTCARTSTT
jgi:ABC-2 type transport system ATP-binding protein